MKRLATTKLTEKLTSDKKGKIEISRKLMGSYCWGRKGKMYIPGYPVSKEKKSGRGTESGEERRSEERKSGKMSRD